MRLSWSDDAFEDLERLRAFLVPKDARAADRVVATLFEAPQRLLLQPRMGPRVEGNFDGEVRRLLMGQYEIRYELTGEDIRILRIFHTREER